jgi:putative transposase
MRKTFKYRLYPNAAQQELLRVQLSEACRLYNAALQERRDAYKSHGKSLDYYEQANQLKEIRASGNLGLANYHCCQEVRPVSGKIKTVSVKREGNHWYACFSCQVSAQPLPENTNQIGIDVGLESFATLSTGEIVDNPGHFAKAEKRLRRTQRRVSRRKKYSKRWRKAVRLVQNVHRDITNQRRDFQHKLSREIVAANQFIAVEDLNVIGLAGGMLAKSVADVGWSSFLNRLAYKAESAGRQLVRVDPRGTSQRCPCGKPAPKKLADRQHVCTCGLRTTRDHASSLEILRLGLSLQPLTAVQ